MGNQSTHVFDCNHREIHVGDRVKLIGEEVALFLDKYCDLPESVACHVFESIEDEIGTVVAGDFFKIVNDSGDMLFDLETSAGRQEDMLEIVSETCLTEKREPPRISDKKPA